MSSDVSGLVQWSVKHRPGSLKEMLCSPSTRKQIDSLIKNPSAHCILITGQTGCGKTTAGRLLAHAFTKTKPGTVTPDIIEKDMADERGIEAARAIVASTRFLPSKKNGKKVYILDEVHAITSVSAASLLKSLEEPPDHVIFVLLTDQPEKLLPSIQNRAMQIRLALPSTKELSKRLLEVLAEEKALPDLSKKEKMKLCTACAEASANTPRSALQILQAAANVSGEYKDLKSLIAGAVMSTPIVDVNRAAAKALVALMLAAEGKPRLKPLMGTINGRDPLPLLDRLLFTANAVLIETSTEVDQVGTYFFKEAAKGRLEKVSIAALRLILTELTNARNKVGEFSVDPGILLSSALVNSHARMIELAGEDDDQDESDE